MKITLFNGNSSLSGLALDETKTAQIGKQHILTSKLISLSVLLKSKSFESKCFMLDLQMLGLWYWWMVMPARICFSICTYVYFCISVFLYLCGGGSPLYVDRSLLWQSLQPARTFKYLIFFEEARGR